MADRLKFYLDEHISKAIALAVRRQGVDVETVREAGLMGASDAEQLAHAIAARRVLVTRDSDFTALHADNPDHWGILFFPRELPVGETVRAILLAHEVIEPKEMRGRLEYF